MKTGVGDFEVDEIEGPFWCFRRQDAGAGLSGRLELFDCFHE